MNLTMDPKKVIVSGVIMLLLDSVYLTTFSNFYNNLIKSIQGEKIQFNIIGALFAYLFLIYGINYFILNQPKTTLTDAFILGVIIYGVYETTNYAIIKKWSPYAIVLDTVWGGILYTLVTYFTRRLIRN
jgi:uncharacterized membrane protein